MKQYQFSYENKDNLEAKLISIKNACEKAPFSDIVFYLT